VFFTWPVEIVSAYYRFSAALSFAGGLWAGKYLWRPPSWRVIAALVCAASAAYLLKRRVIAPRALVRSAVFLTGALTIQVRGSSDSGPIWLGGGILPAMYSHMAERIFGCWLLTQHAQCRPQARVKTLRTETTNRW